MKLEFLRPDFDLEADRFDAEMKRPYFSQMNFKESQGCSSNFAMPEIQMPVQKQDNLNGNYFALGNESWWLKFAYKIIHKAKFLNFYSAFVLSFYFFFKFLINDMF